MDAKNETIIFGSGCFWCSEAVFQKLKGIVSVMPGYAGGTMPNPTYQQVASGTSGYVEVSKVEYNPQEVSLDNLLAVFFTTHDPTQANGQGNDVGQQYLSTIFYITEEQKQKIEAFISKLQEDKVFDKEIVTQVKPYLNFYSAEAEHQNYYQKNKFKPYCLLIINPKLKKLREKFKPLLRAE